MAPVTPWRLTMLGRTTKWWAPYAAAARTPIWGLTVDGSGITDAPGVKRAAQ